MASGAEVLGSRRRWLDRLARHTLELYPRPPLDRPRELARIVAAFVDADAATRPTTARTTAARPATRPVVGTRMLTNRWGLPTLHDLDDLAGWLGLTSSELEWYADPRRLARTTSQRRLQHYRVSHRVASSGAIRVLEAPKLELKGIQRRLLDEVLSSVPPHEAARGFRPGGSVRTYALPHAGRPVVLRLDLESFFASVTVARVCGIWRSAGCLRSRWRHRLSGLVTTTSLPLSLWRSVPRPPTTPSSMRTGGSGAGSPHPTSPRAPPPRRPWPTSPPSGSTCD